MDCWTIHYFTVATAEDLEYVREEWGARVPDGATGFVASQEFQDFEAEPRGLAALAARFAAVIRVGVHRGRGALAYEHWVGGAQRRSLLYAPERKGWYHVAGEPEPWEAALFTPEDRAREVRDAREYEPALVAAIERAYDAGRLVQASRWPSVNPDEVARRIREAHALPRSER